MVGALAMALVALGWWLGRRYRDVDSYHERNYRDPPVFDDRRGM